MDREAQAAEGSDDPGTPQFSTCECKIGRAIDHYRLENLDLELERRYTDQDASLRSLAEYINTRILQTVLEAAEASIAGDAESIYRTLMDDDVPEMKRSDLRMRLVDAGVGEQFHPETGPNKQPLDQVLNDFVSYQTVRSHLNDCLGVSTSRTGVESVEDGREIIEWARSRDEDVIERVLSRLARIGQLDTAESGVDVIHTVRVECRDCGRSVPVSRFLSEGGCVCQQSSGKQ
jgi:hypothetical protein